MSHPLVLGLFDTPERAADAARALHQIGVTSERLSIVAATHEEEGALAEVVGGSPGADLEDSRPAARLAELGAWLVAAVAVVMPGIGPVIGAGPLAAELGEAAGHVAGGVAATLRGAGVDEARAIAWQQEVERGAILLGVHVVEVEQERVEATLSAHAAREVAVAQWD
jgi:hypothetical protein